MRGGPGPPSVLDDTSQNSLPNLPWEGRSPSEEASRMPSRFCPPSFWRGLGPLFHNFFAFFAHLKSASLFCSICVDFSPILEGFGVDLGRILGGFFDDFS